MLLRGVLLSIAVGTVAVGCADLKDILVLQQGLTREFQTNAINVNINNSAYLTILFQNAAIADSSQAAQAAYARRAAEYVRDHYAHYDGLESIQVGFASVKGVGITITSTRIPFRFTPSELGPPRQPKTASAPKAEGAP